MMCLLGIWLAAHEVEPSSLQTLARERGRFGFFTDAKSWEDQVYRNPFYYYDSTMESDVMLFPAGEWNRRYIIKVATISLTEKKNGRLVKVWWARLSGDRGDVLRGSGSLDAYLGRLGKHIRRNQYASQILKSLNASTPFAIYSHTMMTPALEANFIQANGLKSDDWQELKDYKGTGEPPGHGDPYLVTKEEGEWLVSHKRTP